MKHVVQLNAIVLMAGALGLCPAQAEEKEAWRLFVSDHGQPVVHAIDTEEGKLLASFPTKSPATLFASESGRTVFAVQRDGNVVSAISSGIAVHDHGDHGDIEIGDPRLLNASVAGERPVHFVDHHGNVALFFDGEGIVRVVSEASLEDDAPKVREIRTAAPHHGVAISYGDHVVVTVPNKEDPAKLPDSVEVLDAVDKRVGEAAECPGIHGEASSGHLLAIACQTGLLLVKSEAGAPAISHLPYPAGLPEGRKVSTLLGGRGMQYFLGNFGDDAVVVIDPQDENGFRLIDLPMRRVHFAIDPERVKFAYVFTEDGKLHRINVLSAAIADTIPVTGPYSMDGHWSDPRPRLAVAGDEIFVTDPLKGVIHAIDAETFEKTREIAIEGKPFNIAVAGGSGTDHHHD